MNRISIRDDGFDHGLSADEKKQAALRERSARRLSGAPLDEAPRVPGPRRAVAAAVLTELVELGVASDVALAQVHAAVAAGGEVTMTPDFPGLRTAAGAVPDDRHIVIERCVDEAGDFHADWDAPE